MKNIEKKYIFGSLIILGSVFYGVSLYIHTQQAEYVSTMKLLVSEQETTLISIAEVTDRNGADAVVAEIVKDCDTQDRQKFDELLGNLGTLNKAELVEVDQLFGACGDFYAERKALMVARLNREFEVYQDYVTLLDIVDSRSEQIFYPVAKWSELASFELQRSSLSSELVVIQKDIIQALLDGVSVQSAQMLSEVTKAQEVNDTLSYIGVKIDAIREDIIGL
ncbi:MAG: hypothetical protein ACI92I_000055 [Acidimicrobiales bacterium]|jgi:hypothetical protein